jgi:signal transduction histidine kinase
MQPVVQRLHERFLELGLRGKITVVLIVVALLLGAAVFAITGLVARHFAIEHGQEVHFLGFLLPVFGLMGIVIIALIIPLARFSARLISTPLLQVVAAAESIAASGRPTGELSISRNDEFGRLSAAFNIMIQRLGESYTELEQRVAERTREYEESQHEAQKAGNLLREAVQHVAVGFTIYDENDRLAICNEAYLRIYEESRDLIAPGATFEEIVRKGAERGQYQAALGNVDAWVKQRVVQHQSARGEAIEQKLGDGRWLLIIEHRTPSGYIVGNRIDITELKNTSEALREHSDQLNTIFDLSRDGFVSFDANRRVKYISPAFLRMTGLTTEDILGLDEDAFSARIARECLPEASFPGLPALRAEEKVGSGGTAEERRRSIELAGPGKRVLQVGLRHAEGGAVSQILTFRDITHETEIDRMKSEFLSHAAHELRTPMASIFGFTELLLNEEFSAEERRDFLSTIHRQSELLISIVNELLDLARIEARRGKDFVIEPVELGTLLGEIVAGFRPPAGRDGPRILNTVRPCVVRADRNKLRQAVGNILSNAYKYSPGGGPVEIEVMDSPCDDAPAAKNSHGVRVTDHGIGMTPEQRARICERFYRADASGHIPGTGLGMSIVEEIIDLHGGSIDIISQPGEGTQVTFWLPSFACDSTEPQ